MENLPGAERTVYEHTLLSFSPPLPFSISPFPSSFPRFAPSLLSCVTTALRAESGWHDSLLQTENLLHRKERTAVWVAIFSLKQSSPTMRSRWGCRAPRGPPNPPTPHLSGQTDTSCFRNLGFYSSVFGISWNMIQVFNNHILWYNGVYNLATWQYVFKNNYTGENYIYCEIHSRLKLFSLSPPSETRFLVYLALEKLDEWKNLTVTWSIDWLMSFRI